MALTEKLKNIADTIRAKTGGTDPLTLDQMAVEIAGISMGDTSIEDGLLDGTFASESYTNNRITQLRTNALSGFSNLKSFTGTNVKKVLTYSFQNAGIETVHLPSAEMIASRAFQGCASLESISLPSLTTSTAHSTLFLNCKKLKDVHLPNMLCAKTAMFNACTSLEEISLPSVTSIEANVFLEAMALKKVILKHSEVVSLVGRYLRV